MKTINIYLTHKEKQELIKLKYKYHLSISTIANTITEKIYMVLGDQPSEIKPNEKGTKTSIKPKHKEYKNNTYQYTNSLKIFINKELKNYIQDEAKINKVYNFIYQELQNTYEENWDGNRMNRIMPKLIKQNRNYYKKILETEE